MLETQRKATSQARAVKPWLTDLIVKHRKLLLAISLIPLIVTFNARWRIGLDSSIYRGLAQSIARGDGYHFGDFGTHQVYPGLPVILAGFDKLFGENVYRPIGPLMLMVAVSLLILVVTYRLIARHYPLWIAVMVTCGVAINSWFIDLTHEVLTDIPFLLGLMAALLGWDLLRAATSKRQHTKAAVLMSIGLALAATMRPTFWILCLALACAWLWGFVRGTGFAATGSSPPPAWGFSSCFAWASGRSIRARPARFIRSAAATKRRCWKRSRRATPRRPMPRPMPILFPRTFAANSAFCSASGCRQPSSASALPDTADIVFTARSFCLAHPC